MENYPAELAAVAELLDPEEPEAPAAEAEPPPDESELEPFSEVPLDSDLPDADLPDAALPDSRLSVR